MNRHKRSLEPSSIPKRFHKQQVLCDAIEQNYQTVDRTIQVTEKSSSELSITNSLEVVIESLGIEPNLMEAEADCFAGELLI